MLVPMIEDSIQILPASWRDLNPVRKLEKLCFPVDAWPFLDMIGVLSFPNIVRYKAVEGEEVIGFVAGDVRRIERTGWIATICVHPDHRGRGLGSVLLEICEEKMGMPKVKLSVRESNTQAIDMYYRNGYARVGTWRKYYKGGEDGVVMEKVLG